MIYLLMFWRLYSPFTRFNFKTFVQNIILLIFFFALMCQFDFYRMLSWAPFCNILVSFDCGSMNLLQQNS